MNNKKYPFKPLTGETLLKHNMKEQQELLIGKLCNYFSKK